MKLLSRWMPAMLLLALPGAACALELTVKDNGRSFSVPAGEIVTIILAGNSTTGYTWEKEVPPLETFSVEVTVGSHGIIGEWYETGYLTRLKATRSPCRAVKGSDVPRIAVRMDGKELRADLEYRFHEGLSVRLGRPEDRGGSVVVRSEPVEKRSSPMIEKLVWKGGTVPSLKLVHEQGKREQAEFTYRRLSREGLNRLVISGVYRGRSGDLERTLSLTPEGIFESRPLSFGYDLGLDCTFAACDYLQANDGSKDQNRFPLRYGFSRDNGRLMIFPVHYEGGEQLVCEQPPLMIMEEVR